VATQTAVRNAYLPPTPVQQFVPAPEPVVETVAPQQETITYSAPAPAPVPIAVPWDFNRGFFHRFNRDLFNSHVWALISIDIQNPNNKNDLGLKRLELISIHLFSLYLH